MPDNRCSVLGRNHIQHTSSSYPVLFRVVRLKCVAPKLKVADVAQTVGCTEFLYLSGNGHAKTFQWHTDHLDEEWGFLLFRRSAQSRRSHYRWVRPPLGNIHLRTSLSGAWKVVLLVTPCWEFCAQSGRFTGYR